MRTTNHIVGIMSHLRQTLCWHYGCLLISFVHITIIEFMLSILLLDEYGAHTVAEDEMTNTYANDERCVLCYWCPLMDG